MVAPLAMLGLSIASNLVDGIASAVSGTSKTSGSPGTRKTADDFETMFLENTMDRLTQNTGEEGPLGDNGTGGSVYKSMLSKEYAKSIVKSGGLGIADQVYSQMMRMQETHNGG